MASPFRMFRRHQKVWMAVLTVGAMIAFVFLSGQGAMQFLDRKVSNDPVRVRTTKFGNLTQGQVQSMVSNRRRLIGFVTDVGKAVYMAEGKPVEGQNLLNYLSLPPTQDEAEKAVVNTWLLAQEAQHLGQAFSDDEIKGYITALTDRQRISTDGVRQILNQRGIDGEVAFCAC